MSNVSIAGLLGRSLEHSGSPELMRRLAPGLDYRVFPYPEYLVAPFLAELRRMPVLGINVTIPYKVLVLDCVDAVSSGVEAIGATNCIVVRRGHLIAHNTDVTACTGLFGSLSGLTIAILGSGGAARAAAVSARDCGASGIHVLERGQRCHTWPWRIAASVCARPMADPDCRELLHGADVIVNATPVGLPGWPIELPLDVPFRKGHFFLDMTYGEFPSPLLTKARLAGARAEDGSRMLELQAEESLKLWRT